MGKRTNNAIVRRAVGAVISGLLIANSSAITAIAIYGIVAQTQVARAAVVTSVDFSGEATYESVRDEVLERIARCESGGRHLDGKGRVIRGVVNPQDIGKFQINLDSWAKKSKELGFDIFTEDGNTKMAQYLYAQNGTRDWNASKWCWKRGGKLDSDRQQQLKKDFDLSVSPDARNQDDVQSMIDSLRHLTSSLSSLSVALTQTEQKNKIVFDLPPTALASE
jgi:putative hemolysin